MSRTDEEFQFEVFYRSKIRMEQEQKRKKLFKGGISVAMCIVLCVVVMIQEDKKDVNQNVSSMKYVVANQCTKNHYYVVAGWGEEIDTMQVHVEAYVYDEDTGMMQSIEQNIATSNSGLIEINCDTSDTYEIGKVEYCYSADGIMIKEEIAVP